MKLEPLIGKGPPRSLWFGIPREAVSGVQRHEIEATLDGAVIDRVTLAGLRSRTPGRGPRIKVRVDPFTPPGRYEGTATIGTTKIPIVAEVGRAITVRADPPVIEVRPRPGETMHVEVTIENLGNVPTDVPAESSFTLLDRSGFGDAFYHSIAEPPPAGKQRIDVLFDDLAASNGGRVVATATDDTAGPILPNGSRTIQLALAFSEQLRPGAQYAGGWNIDAIHIPVRVAVPPAEPTSAAKPPVKPRSAARPKPAPKEKPS